MKKTLTVCLLVMAMVTVAVAVETVETGRWRPTDKPTMDFKVDKGLAFNGVTLRNTSDYCYELLDYEIYLTNGETYKGRVTLSRPGQESPTGETISNKFNVEKVHVFWHYRHSERL